MHARTIAAATVAALLSGVARPPAADAAASAIKVAFLAPTSGNAAAAGHDMIAGWKLWWSTHSATIDGRTIETTYYDTNSNPAKALEAARQAVERDGAQILVGPYLASEGLAVANYAAAHKVPLLMPTVTADDLSQRTPTPYAIKGAGWTSSITTHAAGAWAYAKGYRNVVTMANAYVFGYENAGGFNRTFTAKGGKIVKQLWSPLGTADYSPYLSQIQAAHPDAVFVEMVGADAVHFLEQWSSFGLKDKIPLIANETTTDQSNIRTLPESDVDGIISFAHYSEARPDRSTSAFVAAFAKDTGVLPSYMAASSYTEGRWLSQALASVRGDISDAPAFLAALHGVKLADSPLGPMQLDAYGGPIENVYIRKVEPTPAAMAAYAKDWNVVLTTYPHVSQFWTFSPQEFLKQPVYSQSYQGIQP